jgi:hypothetical protein
MAANTIEFFMENLHIKDKPCTCCEQSWRVCPMCSVCTLGDKLNAVKQEDHSGFFAFFCTSTKQNLLDLMCHNCINLFVIGYANFETILGKHYVFVEDAVREILETVKRVEIRAACSNCECRQKGKDYMDFIHRSDIHYIHDFKQFKELGNVGMLHPFPLAREHRIRLCQMGFRIDGFNSWSTFYVLDEALNNKIVNLIRCDTNVLNELPAWKFNFQALVWSLQNKKNSELKFL